MRITERLKEKAQDINAHSPIVISFLGDSVTQGCFELYPTGEKTFQTEFRPDEAFSNKLKKLIESVLPNVAINMINAGLSGDKSFGGAERVQRDVISHNPDLCIVCYGLNDVNRGLEQLDVYENALDSIFKQLNEANIEVIFMTPNMMSTYVVEEESNPHLRNVLKEVTKKQVEGVMDTYMEKALEVCAKNNISVCDCYKKWKQLNSIGVDTTRLLANRVNHPAEKMHWLFAASLFEMIMDLK